MGSLNHIEQTNDQIIALCSSPDRILIGGLLGGNRVVKLSEDVVVKFGMGVKAEEAENQRKAYDLLNPAIVRVPRTYRYFANEDNGYIVMEYIKGRVVDPLNDCSLVDRIASIITYLNTHEAAHPGPLGGGVSRGLLWSEYDEVCFESIQDMEHFLDSRLSSKKSPNKISMCLQPFKLVLCHLDIAPRNIVWLDDGSVCLLDWASAGFYPRLFEICGQRVIFGKEGNFNKLLLDSMNDLSMEEEKQAMLILRVFHNIQRYRL